MRLLLTIAALTLASTLVFHAQGAEQEIAFNRLPTNVQKTMQDLVGKGHIEKTVREPSDDGGVLYEVSYTIKKRKFEAEVSPRGKVIVVDQQISLAEAPKAVRRVIEEKTAGGKIIKIEKATQGKEVFYETEFTKGGKEREVKVAPDGRIIAEE